MTMPKQHNYRPTRTAVTRAFVYAALIAVSILLWWAFVQLVVDVGSIRVPTG